MNLQENIPLAPLTTFKVGGPARYFVEASTAAEVIEAVDISRQNNWRIFILGGGSNLVVSDAGWPGMVVKIALRGISERPREGKIEFEAGAGEDWDAFVAHTVARDCAGIETMSGIPGTVGGTPVQNVGAYGQEVAETISRVQVLDLGSMKVRTLTSAECSFSYRNSIFNTSERGGHIVLSVSFSLTPGGPARITYADLQKYFAAHPGPPSLLETRNAVREIRHTKAMLIVPGDEDCRSAGSFFKNPILDPAQFDVIAAKSNALPPRYPTPEGKVKMSAAWLVEQSGFTKGYGSGRAGISNKHALAIVNRGGANADEIVALRDEVWRGVRDKFGIELQTEPVLVGFVGVGN